MRASRLVAILLVLQSRARVAAHDLAREFEVSVRTIYRDVDALSAAGFPIYAEAGRSGGIALHEGYRARLTTLTPAEVAALPLAGLAHAARDLGVADAAGAAQLKLLASLPAPSGDLARRVAARFHVDAIPWYHRAEVVPHLPELAAAIWRDRRIAIAYESWRGDVTRRLDPLGLVQKGGLWYLVAAARGRVRTYRVSNIRRLDVLDMAAQRPKRFDLAVYWTAWAHDFEARLTPERARVRISEEGRRILRAIAPAAADIVAESARPSRAPGWVTAAFPIESVDYSARQILRLGAEIEVLAPPALRTAVHREARAVAALYARPRHG